MAQIYLQRITNLVIYAILLFANGPGFTGSLKDPPSTLPEHPSIIVPARYAFALWLPIHVFLLMFVIYQLLPKTYNLGFINTSITPLFYIHCIGNIGWVTLNKLGSTEYYEYQWMRIFFMPVMFIPLVLSYLRTNNRVAIDMINNSNSVKNYYQNYWFGRVWLSLYAGWVMYAFTMDLFSCIDVPATKNGFLIASATVSIIGLIVVFIIRVYSDAALGILYTWVFYWLSVKNHVESSSPRQYLYHTSLVLFWFVFFITIVTLVRNIAYCIRRRDHASRRGPVRPDEGTPINNSNPSYSA